jgi:hypothetical protein
VSPVIPNLIRNLNLEKIVAWKFSFSMCRFQLCVEKATDFVNVPRNVRGEYMNKLGVPGCLRQPVGLYAIPLSL